MRKILLLPLLFISTTILLASLVNAQQPKVFILSRPVSNLQLDSAVGAVTKYDTGSSLPINLSTYTAVLVVVLDTLSTTENAELINYIKTGGKLYIEPVPHPSGIEVSGTLNYQIGIRGVFADDLVRRWDYVFGVDSEFTRGFKFLNPNTDPTRADDIQGIHWNGLITPVLLTHGFAGLARAWIPKDTIIHAVIHHPAFPEYYSAFVQLVLCDYFHVCSLSVTEPVTKSNDLNITYSLGQLNIWYNISENKAATLKIENDLGKDVMEIPLTDGEHVATIASTLPSGEYYGVINMGGKPIVRAFSVTR